VLISVAWCRLLPRCAVHVFVLVLVVCDAYPCRGYSRQLPTAFLGGSRNDGTVGYMCVDGGFSARSRCGRLCGRVPAAVFVIQTLLLAFRGETATPVARARSVARTGEVFIHSGERRHRRRGVGRRCLPTASGACAAVAHSIRSKNISHHISRHGKNGGGAAAV